MNFKPENFAMEYTHPKAEADAATDDRWGWARLGNGIPPLHRFW